MQTEGAGRVPVWERSQVSELEKHFPDRGWGIGEVSEGRVPEVKPEEAGWERRGSVWSLTKELTAVLQGKDLSRGALGSPPLFSRALASGRGAKK